MAAVQVSVRCMMSLFFRALFAVLALPGLSAGVIPIIVVSKDPWRGEGSFFGVALLALGALVVVWCVRDFYTVGKGTLAPWDPPRHLVVVGLYRYTRNPMYIGVLLLIVGWSIAAGSPLLACYAVALAMGFHLRVRFHEEPRLRKKFGAEWIAYSASVPRWVPRLSSRRK